MRGGSDIDKIPCLAPRHRDLLKLLPAALKHFKRLFDARGCDVGCDAGMRTFLLVSHFLVRSSHSGTLANIQEASDTRKVRLAKPEGSCDESVPRQAHLRLHHVLPTVSQASEGGIIGGAPRVNFDAITKSSRFDVMTSPIVVSETPCW